jgi:hypothetical protein
LTSREILRGKTTVGYRVHILLDEPGYIVIKYKIEDKKERYMTPTIVQVLKCYKIIADVERAKTGRPGEGTKNSNGACPPRN